MSDNEQDPQVDRLIDENLRRAYQRKVKEDLPERLLDLVDKLRHANGNDGAEQKE